MALIRGSLAFICYVINTLFWAIPILLGSLVKLIPLKPLQRVCSRFLDSCATGWISTNGLIEQLFHPVKLHIEAMPELSTQEWYMVIANHQSWVDILMLQRLLNGRVPFLKFFLKQQLIYVPVLGLAWWALDFPFMRRYTTAQLKKNPKLKGKDIEITRKACAKFKHNPVSVMNFVEGTRFLPEKHAKQNSPYKHLLRPKAGGMAFALSAMGEQIHQLLNVTIHYPNKIPTFWEYISGKVKDVYVAVELTEIGAEMRGDYMNDREFKQQFQEQLNQLWLHKDEVFAQLQAKASKEKA
ncbi:acyltransferase [Shewanella sp. A3A]|uniref:Acyltransferase n=1 Tax=Shewanella electrica TaxID=515560 RepID=A0ABT2FMQ7_9GAMM|nr:acyltransferase [Shewanella electrica]MCH1920849.1 acyltransferase [Shewanella ferrihydritica]MCH1926213.1 acyltransferase [Shewanella electrica]MCS4557622.1 acyltransferase [Shewanella electrica]